MFVGAINETVRKYIANNADAFSGRNVVVGCSGNFTFETVLSRYAKPAAIHSNDVSFYSCMAGRWLTHQPLAFAIADPDFAWLEPYLDSDERRLATIMVLLDMLEWEKRDNPHRQRMWQNYRASFDGLVEKTIAKISATDIRVTSYYAGDVVDHVERHRDDPNAVFAFFAPTYKAGYERLYKRLHQIVRWDAPHYELLDDARRDRLLASLEGRAFLWFDDRRLEQYAPVMEQRSGRMKTVYLYSNAIERPAYFTDRTPLPLPKLPLATDATVLTSETRVWLQQISTSDLARFKDVYLSKKVRPAAGQWAFAVMADDVAIGFIEYARGKWGGTDEVYLQADFALPLARYKRLSKLIVMLTIAGESRRVLERLSQLRKRTLVTTAFTDRPVSMKYRGVLDLLKRGVSPQGEAFLNYGGTFTDRTWQETYRLWLTKHGSASS